MTEYFKTLTEKEKERLKKLFDRSDDDPVFEFYQDEDSEEGEDENPADRHNLQYAP